MVTLVEGRRIQHVVAISYSEREVAKTNGRSHSNGHGKPGESAKQEPPGTVGWLAGHCALPVGLVNEDGAEVTCNEQLNITKSSY